MRFQLCSPYFCTAINQGPHPPASPAGPRRSSRWRSNSRSHARSLVFHGDLPRKKNAKIGIYSGKMVDLVDFIREPWHFVQIDLNQENWKWRYTQEIWEYWRWMGFLNNQIIPPNTWPGNNTENDMYDMLTITSGWNGVPNFQTNGDGSNRKGNIIDHGARFRLEINIKRWQ